MVYDIIKPSWQPRFDSAVGQGRFGPIGPPAVLGIQKGILAKRSIVAKHRKRLQQYSFFTSHIPLQMHQRPIHRPQIFLDQSLPNVPRGFPRGCIVQPYSNRIR